VQYIKLNQKPQADNNASVRREQAQDQASRLAAALAYYTTFSLALLLLIIIAVVGFVWGQADVRSQMIMQTKNFTGRDRCQFDPKLAG
jgi:membrane protein